MREAIGGLYANNLAHNLGMLLLFVLPSVLVGVTCRSHLVNINALFDQRLRETDHLMVSEPTLNVATRYRLATVVKAIHTPEAYRQAIERRAAAFHRAYPHLKRRGIACLLLLPPILLALACLFDDKLPLIALLVVVLVVLYAYLIVLEYLDDHIAHKLALCDLTPSELDDLLAETLSEEVLATVPIDDILEAQGRELPHERLAERIHERAERRRAGRTKAPDEDGPGAGGEPPQEEDVDTKGGDGR
jgi:putative membrane protein